MTTARRDGLVLDGPDGLCILVRGTSLPDALGRARQAAGAPRAAAGGQP